MLQLTLNPEKTSVLKLNEKAIKSLIKYGLELEGVYNRDSLKSALFDKHNENGDRISREEFLINPKKTIWKVSQDGSLRDKGTKFNNPTLKEIYNVKPLNRGDLIKNLLEFQKAITNEQNKEFFEVLEFNKSCGLHFHFSIENFSLGQFALFSTFAKARKSFFIKMENSKIKSKYDIMKHYNRKYSRAIKKNRFVNLDLNFNQYLGYDNGKYYEFNHQSELHKKGFEWRSPNLLNITTWAEFYEGINIYLDIIEELFINLKNQQDILIKRMNPEKMQLSEMKGDLTRNIFISDLYETVELTADKDRINNFLINRRPEYQARSLRNDLFNCDNCGDEHPREELNNDLICVNCQDNGYYDGDEESEEST